MKRVSKFIMILFLVLSFSSCNSGDDDPIVEDNGVTTGDYFRLVSNNKWWYIDNSGQVSLVYVGYPETIDGTPYYFINDDGGEFDIPQWMAKKGASYYQRYGQIFQSLNNGATLEIGEYEIKLFRDDLPVGATWNGSTPLDVVVHNNGSHQTLPASLHYTGTVLEREATETLDSGTYSNVIKISFHAVETVNGQVTNIDAEYWLAKDIGLIRESVTSSTDNVTKTRYLTSFEPSN